jgi:hypothetical protein
LDQAIAFLRQVLRQNLRVGLRGNDCGYDFQVSSMLDKWAASHQLSDENWTNVSRRVSPVFFDAAWELTRRGILRPSVREFGIGEGKSDGGGYSLTSQGEAWLASTEESNLEILEPGALAAAFGLFRAKFGDGYHQRTQEAIKCRNSKAWLATCTMVGAAVESILFAAAIAKTGDEKRILRAYITSRGPKKIPDIVVGRAPDYIARPFRAGMNLLAYWRDIGAHGRMIPISALEADQALHQLWTLSQFSFDNWDELTRAE